MVALLAAVSTPALAQSASEKLDALDKRITRLEDLNQIEKLQRLYGYFVDKGQWTQLSELFADDATLEIGGKGLFLGKKRVLDYMQTAFGPDGAREGGLANHMQFQTLPDVSADGTKGWIRSRAWVMSSGGWGLPLYEDGSRQGKRHLEVQARIRAFHHVHELGGLGEECPQQHLARQVQSAPDLPPSTIYLTYPAYYIIPFHYPNPVTGKVFRPDMDEVGAYAGPPGSAAQKKWREDRPAGRRIAADRRAAQGMRA